MHSLTRPAPNGRRVGSSSAEYYLDAVYSSFRAPAKNAENYDAKVKRSVVGGFNLSQQASGLPTVNNESARTWLKQDRPSTAICPPKSDYCDACKHYTEEINRAQTTFNRLHESGSADEAALKQQSDLVSSYQLLLQDHKDISQSWIDEYKQQRKASLEKWKKIQEIGSDGNAAPEMRQELIHLKETFVCVIDADYQIGKLLPHWDSRVFIL